LFFVPFSVFLHKKNLEVYFVPIGILNSVILGTIFACLKPLFSNFSEGLNIHIFWLMKTLLVCVQSKHTAGCYRRKTLLVCVQSKHTAVCYRRLTKDHQHWFSLKYNLNFKSEREKPVSHFKPLISSMFLPRARKRKTRLLSNSKLSRSLKLAASGKRVLNVLL
jgi:hypothetical protein